MNTYDEREIRQSRELRRDGTFEHDARQGESEENDHAKSDVLDDVDNERHERHQTD